MLQFGDSMKGLWNKGCLGKVAILVGPWFLCGICSFVLILVVPVPKEETLPAVTGAASQASRSIDDEAEGPFGSDAEPTEGAETTLTSTSEKISSPSDSEDVTTGEPQVQLPDGVTYEIIDVKMFSGSERSVDVRLSDRINKPELEALARRIHDSDEDTYARTYIDYYLPSMEVGSFPWATTYFEPDLNVNVIGLTADEASALVSDAGFTNDRDVVGRWLDDTHSITIFRLYGFPYEERVFTDGSSGVYELVESNTARGMRFEDKSGSDFGDHYIVKPGGDLEFHDNEGLFRTLPPAPE